MDVFAQRLPDLWGRHALEVVQVDGVAVGLGQRQHRLEHLAVIRGDLRRLLHQLFQRYRAAAKEPAQKIPAGVERHPDEPGPLVLLTLKTDGAESIFQKHILKDVLGVRVVFQMNQAQPANRIGVPLHSPVDLLLAAHTASRFPVSLSAPARSAPSAVCPVARVVAHAVPVRVHMVTPR